MKTKHSRDCLSDGGFNSLAAERAVTDIFQINKATWLLQDGVHIYMIYSPGSWPIEAGGAQRTSSKLEATQALRAPSKDGVHVQSLTESFLGTALDGRH